MMDTQNERLKNFGDRTSSFMTLYPGFQSYKQLAQFMETSRARVLANEPWTEFEERAAVFSEFAKESQLARLQPLMVPVSKELAVESVKKGCFAFQVGIEPIFNLNQFFQFGFDPVSSFPIARSMQKRGGVVREISWQEVQSNYRIQFETMVSYWKETRKPRPWGFLGQCDPFFLGEQKRWFVLEFNKKTQAFASLVPVPAKNAYFFADYIRAKDAKAGAVELLILDAMRMLHDSGVAEARLGLCPMAGLEKPEYEVIGTGWRPFLFSWLMNLGFRKLKSTQSLRSIYEFKKKLEPTRWEPLFLVSKRPVGFWTMRTFQELVYGRSTGVKQWIQGAFKDQIPNRPVRVPLSVAVVGVCLILHALKVGWISEWVASQGFRPTQGNIWIAPFFHNHGLHLVGDLVTLLVFGGLVEFIYGRVWWAILGGAGLWLSNLATDWILLRALASRPVELTNYLQEVDFGTSNAVFAFVGFLALRLKNPSLLLVPFLVDAAIVIADRSSWLAIHHVVALVFGLVGAKIYSRLTVL